jgi:hypothetical protein
MYWYYNIQDRSKKISSTFLVHVPMKYADIQDDPLSMLSSIWSFTIQLVQSITCISEFIVYIWTIILQKYPLRCEH